MVSVPFFSSSSLLFLSLRSLCHLSFGRSPFRPSALQCCHVVTSWLAEPLRCLHEHMLSVFLLLLLLYHPRFLLGLALLLLPLLPKTACDGVASERRAGSRAESSDPHSGSSSGSYLVTLGR